MRLLHTADWHLGRLFYGHHVTEDQAYVLEGQLFDVLQEQKVDGLIIAGDIFDRSVPPVEAIALWDHIVTRLAEMEISVFVIAGNHDGAERLAAGRSFYASKGIHIWGTPDQCIAPYIWEKEGQSIAICPMPFAEPRLVFDMLSRQGVLSLEADRSEFSYTGKGDMTEAEFASDDLFVDLVEEEQAKSFLKTDYHETYRQWADYLLSQVPRGMPSIAISHAFVAGSVAGGSERQVSVGGSDFVKPVVYRNFSYAALGHIHGSQGAGEEYIRYSGSPLKYSFDEVKQEKSFTIIDMDDQGAVELTYIPIRARNDVVVLTGTLDQLMNDIDLQQQHAHDYILAQLTDLGPVVDGMATLRKAYPHVLALELVGRQHQSEADLELGHYRQLNAKELFKQFAQAVWQEELSEEEEEYMAGIWKEVEEEV